MSNKQFISNLSATYADVRKLDAKKINLKGKNILEYIKENETVILDERGTKADDTLDVWNSYVTKDEDGNVIINRSAKPFEHNYEYLSNTGKIVIMRGSSCVHVIDNEILDANNEHVIYWQTDGFTSSNNSKIFYNSIKTFSSALSNLKNGYSMFSSCANLTTFNSDLSSLTKGNSMFYYCSNLETFSSDLSNLTDGTDMFFNCSKLTSLPSDLPSLTEGTQMFYYCENLSEFSSDLSSLMNGRNMFNGCTNLTSFTSDLSSLTDGTDMFYKANLETFSSDLSSLTDGGYMFGECKNLKSFSSNMSSLTEGTNMFSGCFNLTSFSSDLSSLISANYMFNGCKLDAQSVANIIHFIRQKVDKPTNTWGDGNIQIGIGITNTDAAKQAFAEECDCDDWADLNQEFDDKNWGVQWQFNGPASYSLRDPRPSTAVYTKLEEVFMPTEEEITAAKEKGERIEIPSYQYTSQDGDNYYNIHWYHESNTDNEGYDYFESLEMATLAYSVIPRA